jgi:hypothetical protein
MALPPRSSPYCLVWRKDQCWDQLCSFFTLYASFRLVRALGVDCHFFSDYSQLYKIFRTFRRLLLGDVSQQEVYSALADCFAVIHIKIQSLVTK